MQKYITYVARYEDEVLYIGEGKEGRDKHCTSGISNVYGLNALYHTGFKVKVDVVFESNEKEEVKNYETELIHFLKPRFNLNMGNYSKTVAGGMIIKGILRRFHYTTLDRLLSHSVDALLFGVYNRKTNTDCLPLNTGILFEPSPYKPSSLRLSNTMLDFMHNKTSLAEICKKIS